MSKDKSVFDELIPTDDLTLQQILNNLLDGKHNLDLKSEIFKPKDLASLKILSEFLGKLKYSNSQIIIESFIKTYLRYMVSFERKSRKEIISAISNLLQQQSNDLSKRITKNLA